MVLKKKDAEESKLFRAVMKDVKPLKRHGSPIIEYPRVAMKRIADLPSLSNGYSAKVSSGLFSSSSQSRPSYLKHGDIPGVDRRTGRRFKRGQLCVEARLDLHGMNQREAYKALEAFLANQQFVGRRCIMVVTGKGVGKEGGGVLRRAVPRWLNEAPNRGRVLAFEYARQKDGGVGALYVLLKRYRMG